MRLAGYGLVLLALGGYEQASPVELSLSLLGLVALAVGEQRALPYGERNITRVGLPEWRAFVGRLAAGVGDGTGPDEVRPEAVVVAEGELEVSRIRTHRRGQPVTIKLLRKRGTPVELDASFGSAGHASPDASIERHRRWLERSPEARLKLPRVKTGDPAFDQKFSVHGAAPLADAELRRRLERQQGDGVLTIWHGSAARYQLSHPQRRRPAGVHRHRRRQRARAVDRRDRRHAGRPGRSVAAGCRLTLGRARYGAARRRAAGVGGGGAAWRGRARDAAWLGRGGWLSSSRICRRAAGASGPPGAAARYFLYASTAWAVSPAERYASPRPNSACG